MIRNEYANPVYTTPFMCALFEEEGGDLFDVRQAILGHLQQGGDPSPFDRIQATRLATRCIDYLIEQAGPGINPKAPSLGCSRKDASSNHGRLSPHGGPKYTSARKSSGGWTCAPSPVCWRSRAPSQYK